MNINNQGKEFWIWTELLAFDNTQPDQGVNEYLNKIGRIPDGIALMIGHPDFIFRRIGLETEQPLLRAYCSRHGHDRNTLRFRQNWTNYQLRDLVARLKQAGVKICLSIFGQNLGDRFHKEWLNEHLEPDWFGILPDGQEVQDIFIENLRQVMLDYGFSGWHGADSTAGRNRITCDTLYIAQELFDKFLEDNAIPESEVPVPLRHIDNHDFDARMRRSSWIWDNYPRKWQDFYSGRMNRFLLKTADMLHEIGCIYMQNTCWAKSAFESWFYFGIDHRILKQANIDYLVLETVATSGNLIYGTREFPCRDHHVYCCEQEMAAALPNTRMLSLTGVCDPVESFNSLLHAPTMLERDIYCCANQNLLTADGERRCVDGMVVCLGDNLTAPDWKLLRQFHSQAYDFPNLGSEGYVWLYSDTLYDHLKDDYPVHGTFAPYIPTGELALRAVMLSCVCRSENLDAAADRPLFVPDFDLLPDDEYQKILARKNLTILLGNISSAALPPDAQIAAKTETLNGYVLGLVILNGKDAGPERHISPVTQHFDMREQFNHVGDYIPYMQVNPEFWDVCSEIMRAQTFHPFSGPGFAVIRKTADNCRRVAIGSEVDKYYVPEFTFEKREGHTLSLVSTYVCTDPVITEENKLSGSGAKSCYNNIFVPPRGIFIFEDACE